MSEYSDEGFDMDSAKDDKPVREKALPKSSQKPGTAPAKKVGFKLGGGIDKFDDLKKNQTGTTRPEDSVKLSEHTLPNSIKKQNEKDALELRKKTLTLDDIVSDSQSNKHIIYKFMKKGFIALTAEELACTMVNPTFSFDFMNNAKEHLNVNDQTLVVEKLQRC